MFFETPRIRRLSQTIRKPTTGASVRQASVSRHDTMKAKPRQVMILSGSVTAPPYTDVMPPASMSEVPVTWAMKPAEPHFMNWARSSSNALSNTLRRMLRLMVIATQLTSSVEPISITCFRNVLITTKATTRSTVWKGSRGSRRSSQGASRSAE